MMAHGEADLGPALTPTDQHKLDTWQGLYDALERTTSLLDGIAEGKPELHAVRLGRAALKAARA